MKKRVLVVDDDEDVRETVRQMLEEHGYEVELSGEYLHAYQLLRRRQYDAAILDVKLGRGTTSAEILRGLFRDGKGRPPVIALSGLPADEVQRHFGALPPFIKKPPHLQELLMLLAKITGTQGA